MFRTSRHISLVAIDLGRHENDAAPAGGDGTSKEAGIGSPQEPVVVYGKAPTDDGTGANDGQGQTAPAAPSPEERLQEYARYKDAYKDLYQQDFEKALGTRLKTRETEIREMRGIVDPLLAHFGMKTRQELMEFIQRDILPRVKDSDGYKALTEAAGDAQGDQGATDGSSEADVAEHAAQWVQEGLALKAKLEANGETFDLAQELENPEFERLLKSGVSVEKAYNAVHLDEIIVKQAAKAANLERQKVWETVRAKGVNAIGENANRPTPAVIHKSDPNSFTDADLEQIRKQVMKGVKIPL